MKAGDVLSEYAGAKVIRWLGSACSGCHGYVSLVKHDGSNIIVPGWDLPPGTEVAVEIKVTIQKLGKKLSKKCENPWPAHKCK